MTEKPFIHDYAYSNVKSNFIFHDDIAKKILKIIDKKGVINIGGKAQSIYKFAIKNKKNVKKKISKGEFPKKMDMNLKKLKKIINK
jgi:dTDP-4-dehydrorhamnose reductase